MENIDCRDKNLPDAVLSRILEVYGIENKWGWKSILADKLGVKQPAVTGWGTRGVPDKIIAKISREENVYLLWLETGEGVMRPGSVNPLPADLAEMVNDLQAEYGDNVPTANKEYLAQLMKIAGRLSDEALKDLLIMAAASLASEMPEQ